eukprot:4884714-Pyramimonas_sp.AAC.2
MKPPSCSWRQMRIDGQPIYMNEITHQTSWVRPPALCWKVRARSNPVAHSHHVDRCAIRCDAFG